jgi:hypothetical protein
MESREFDGHGQTAFNEMQAVDLSINQVTGAVDGHGPGYVTTVRKGASQTMLSRPGIPLEKSDQSADAAQHTKPDDNQLTYLNVQFQKTITGNLNRRELTFADQVKTVYGPVTAWDAQLTSDDPAALGPSGAILNCDQLTVREMNSSGSVSPTRGPVELEALGNTLVEGETFTARAHRLTFTEEKDLLVLEGDGRTDAQLFRQPRPGAATTQAAARKIMYWRNTNRVEVDDARYFDLGGFGPPGTQPATKPTVPPSPIKPIPNQRPARALPRGGFRG